MSYLIPVVAGLLGTIAMTLFTHLAFILLKTRYKVVRILAHLLRFRPFYTETKISRYIHVLANIIHYSIGILFGYSYQWLIYKNVITVNLPDTLLFGVLIAFLAISTWQLSFAFHSNPPPLRIKQYLSVIWIGHIILAIVMYYIFQSYSVEQRTVTEIPLC